MKPLFYVVVAISFALFSCSESLDKVVVLTHPNNAPALVKFYDKKDSTQQTVKTIRYYFNGERQEEVYYANEKKHGAYNMWYVNGKKMIEAYYVNDFLDGKFTQWYDSGKKSYEAQYSEGTPSGTWKYYNTDGSLKSEHTY